MQKECIGMVLERMVWIKYQMENYNHEKMKSGVGDTNQWWKYLPHKCEKLSEDTQKSLYMLGRYVGSSLILTWEGRDRASIKQAG